MDYSTVQGFEKNVRIIIPGIHWTHEGERGYINTKTYTMIMLQVAQDKDIDTCSRL